MIGPAKLANKMRTASVVRTNSANKKYWKQARKPSQDIPFLFEVL
jgi:hypothetical protein